MLQVDGIEWLVDAFNGGELTALEDAEEVLGKLMGAQVNTALNSTTSKHFIYFNRDTVGLCMLIAVGQSD